MSDCSSSSSEEDYRDTNLSIFYDHSESAKMKSLHKAMRIILDQAIEEFKRKKKEEVIGEELDNSEEEKIAEEETIEEEPVEEEKEKSVDLPQPPNFPVNPPYNYKELKTIHYAKFFTSCLFTPR